MGSGVHLFPLPPKAVGWGLWVQFIEDRCFPCEIPKDGCTDMSADREQAKKCFDRWMRLLDSHEDTATSGAAENHYPTMDIEDICALEVPCADDSVLFLWTTMPQIKNGLRVLESWGFRYKTGMVWVKDKIGIGSYARLRHELVLIGTRGKIETPDYKNRPDSVIEAPRRRHSEKPTELYEIIERMYPEGKYLELFARNAREGWRAWGDEI